jgi:hypothetical protein
LLHFFMCLNEFLISHKLIDLLLLGFRALLR